MQVLANLLSNAVKFTDCGAVHVDVCVEEEAADLVPPAREGYSLAAGWDESEEEDLGFFSEPHSTTSDVGSMGGHGVHAALAHSTPPAHVAVVQQQLQHKRASAPHVPVAKPPSRRDLDDKAAAYSAPSALLGGGSVLSAAAAEDEEEAGEEEEGESAGLVVAGGRGSGSGWGSRVALWRQSACSRSSVDETEPSGSSGPSGSVASASQAGFEPLALVGGQARPGSSTGAGPSAAGAGPGLLGAGPSAPRGQQLQQPMLQRGRRDVRLGEGLAELARASASVLSDPSAPGWPAGRSTPRPHPSATAQGAPAGAAPGAGTAAAAAAAAAEAGQGVCAAQASQPPPRNPPARRVRFSVRDTGIGVAPHLAGRLFQCFRQGQEAMTRR